MITAAQTFSKGKIELNKLASNDYDNLPAWEWINAFNTFQVLYTRFLIRQAERDKTAVSDINFLVEPKDMKVTNQQDFAQTSLLPANFLNWSRLSIIGKKGECEKRTWKLYASEEANAGTYLQTEGKKPSFAWGETFYTFVGRRIRIYTGDDFKVINANLIYYRRPKDIAIEGQEDEFGVSAGKPINPEWNDDTCQLIISGAVAKIAGNIEYLNKYQLANQEIQTFK